MNRAPVLSQSKPYCNGIIIRTEWQSQGRAGAEGVINLQLSYTNE